MVLWGQMGDQVLGLTQSADAARGVSHYATKKADGSLQVLSINKSGNAETVTVSFSGFDPSGRDVRIHTLTPVGDRSSRDVRYNGVTNPRPEALPAAAQQRVSSASFSHALAANSISVLDFAAPASGSGGSSGTGAGGTAGAPTSCSTRIASSSTLGWWGVLGLGVLALTRLSRRRR
jgi:MYXO-CTERM domain-containing protein